MGKKCKLLKKPWGQGSWKYPRKWIKNASKNLSSANEWSNLNIFNLFGKHYYHLSTSCTRMCAHFGEMQSANVCAWTCWSHFWLYLQLLFRFPAPWLLPLPRRGSVIQSLSLARFYSTWKVSWEVLLVSHLESVSSRDRAKVIWCFLPTAPRDLML